MSNTTVTTETDGNNESVSHGIAPQADGSFLAMTRTRSKSFKTLRGAERWLARNYSSKYALEEAGR